MKRVLLSLLLTLFVFSCGKEEGVPSIENNLQAQNNDSQVPNISKLRWYPYTWKKVWSSELIKYVNETELLNIELEYGDLEKLNCLGYRQANDFEKRHFWLVFMSSISSQESSFNPNTRYYEKPLREWSEGLFQLSLSDKKPNGACAVLNPVSILKPLPNIRCALDIMEIQLKGNKRNGRSAGRLLPDRLFYWSVLTRPETQEKLIAFFKRHLEELPFC